MTNQPLLRKFYAGCRIVVTGGAGTVGQALIPQLLQLGAAEIRVLDNNEGELFRLASEQYADEARVNCRLCDIRNVNELIRVFHGADLVFHAAALKNLDMCERAPVIVIETNISGTQNVIQAAIATGVRKVLFTSSDKAVNPTSVMGTSKLMGERLVTAANTASHQRSGTVFATSRFGNVAGSRGSVIPLFCNQIKKGGPVTVTHAGMTRFVMTLATATDLLIRSMTLARGGEVFVTKMPVVRIVDLANALIEVVGPLYGYRPERIAQVTIGARAGEKLWEELTTDEELRRTFEVDDFFVVLPAFRDLYKGISYDYIDQTTAASSRIYVSSNEPAMPPDQLKAFLKERDVLPNDLAAKLRAM